MSCDFPIKCKHWVGNKCTFDFENWDGNGIHPCEEHQKNIDSLAEREFWKAYNRGDFKTAEVIRSSPFTTFGKR